MIKLVDLIRETYNGDEGKNPEDVGFTDFWLSPDGKFYDTEGDHDNWAKEHDMENIETAMSFGWARLVREEHNGQLTLHVDAKYLTPKQKSALQIWFHLHPEIRRLS